MKRIVVTPDDFDENNHVNNVSTLGYLLSTLKPNDAINSIRVSFHKQIKDKGSVIVKKSQNNFTELYYFVHNAYPDLSKKRYAALGKIKTDPSKQNNGLDYVSIARIIDQNRIAMERELGVPGVVNVQPNLGFYVAISEYSFHSEVPKHTPILVNSAYKRDSVFASIKHTITLEGKNLVSALTRHLFVDNLEGVLVDSSEPIASLPEKMEIEKYRLASPSYKKALQ